MIYKHILVAVDLSKSSHLVINKALSIAKDSGALISLIFVEANYANYCLALPNGNWGNNVDVAGCHDELVLDLQKVADKVDYPIANVVVEMGDLNHTLNLKVKALGADLLVCGHHHDFWRHIVSSVKNLINSSEIDLLLVHLEGDD